LPVHTEFHSRGVFTVIGDAIAAALVNDMASAGTLCLSLVSKQHVLAKGNAMKIPLIVMLLAAGMLTGLSLILFVLAP
jgi:hypothetical protein